MENQSQTTHGMFEIIGFGIHELSKTYGDWVKEMGTNDEYDRARQVQSRMHEYAPKIVELDDELIKINKRLKENAVGDEDVMIHNLGALARSTASLALAAYCTNDSFAHMSAVGGLELLETVIIPKSEADWDEVRQAHKYADLSHEMLDLNVGHEERCRAYKETYPEDNDSGVGALVAMLEEAMNKRPVMGA